MNREQRLKRREFIRARMEFEARMDEVEATICSISAAGVQNDKITATIYAPENANRLFTDYPIVIGFKK